MPRSRIAPEQRGNKRSAENFIVVFVDGQADVAGITVLLDR